MPNYIKNLTKSSITLIEQLKNATGIDITKLSNKEGGQSNISLPPERK
jgi:hypothetical protein